ncbi:MAG: hypothetical protein H0T51_23455 [Pirellulales bacterium]|nr:hypothetical protein [Pirellulales bacterium]
MGRGTVAALAAFLVGSTALANEIPLDTIWAFDIPGTRDIAGIPLPEVDQRKHPGPDHESYRIQRSFCIESMRQQLTAKPSSVEAMQGFLIPRRVDLQTLQQASSRLQMNKKLGMPFPFGRLPEGEYPVSE